MGHPRFNTDQIVTRGQEIYETQLLSKLEPEYIGKYLVIDIESGEYEIDDDDMSAALRAFRKKPDGARFEMRIGYRASMFR